MAYDMLDSEYAETEMLTDAAEENSSPRSDIKKFHLNDLLSLTTGLMLAQEGAAAMHRLVAFVMETDADPSLTALHLETVKACIEAQCPFLADVKLESLYPIFKYDPAPTNPYLTVWLEMQGLHFGEEHEIITLRAWKAMNGIMDDAEDYARTA
jgi:hypothetical protein